MKMEKLKTKQKTDSGGCNSPGNTCFLVCSCSRSHCCRHLRIGHRHHCLRVSCCCCVLALAALLGLGWWHRWGWGGGVIGVEVVAWSWSMTVAAMMRGRAWWWWEGKGWRGSVWTSITQFGKWQAAVPAWVISWLYFLHQETLLWCSLLEHWILNLCSAGVQFPNAVPLFCLLLLILNIIQYN